MKRERERERERERLVFEVFVAGVLLSLVRVSLQA